MYAPYRHENTKHRHVKEKREDSPKMATNFLDTLTPQSLLTWIERRDVRRAKTLSNSLSC